MKPMLLSVVLLCILIQSRITCWLYVQSTGCQTEDGMEVQVEKTVSGAEQSPSKNGGPSRQKTVEFSQTISDGMSG